MSTFAKAPCDEAVIRAGSGAAPGEAGARSWILLATILGSSMAFVDSTVVNVALPALQADFGATVSEVQWVVESYALLLAALLLVGGALGDHLGRRRVFALGVAIFAAASAWCGLAGDVHQLIAARAVQGVGAALLVPGSLAIISASFADEERGRAIGTWSGFTGLTAALGPVLGGWLVDHASWRWAFFVNVPLALAVLVILWLRVPESRDDTASSHIDWAGAALVVIGLGGLVYGLIEAPNRGWSNPAVAAALVAGAGALIAFVGVEARVSRPMMPLALFRSRVFSGANVLTLLLYAALAGALFFLPFNLVQVQGYTATFAGAALLPFVVIMFMLSRWAGSLVHRYGARGPLTIGPAIAAAGFALFALPATGGTYWTTFFAPVVVLGIGMAVSVAPLSTTVMSAVPRGRAGVASGINNAVSRTGGLIAIAVFGIVMAAQFNASLDARLERLDLPPEMVRSVEQQRTKFAGMEIPPGPEARQDELRRAIQESFVAGFRLVMLLAAGLAALSALSAWLMIEPGGAGAHAVGEDGAPQPG